MLLIWWEIEEREKLDWRGGTGIPVEKRESEPRAEGKHRPGTDLPNCEWSTHSWIAGLGGDNPDRVSPHSANGVPGTELLTQEAFKLSH